MSKVISFNLTQRLLGILGFKPLLCHSRQAENAIFCEGCEPGSVFECEGCKRLMPYCWGAADEYEEFCDECVGQIELTKKIQEVMLKGRNNATTRE